MKGNILRRLIPSLCVFYSLSSAGLPAADFDIVGREMSRMLQNGHYARLPFNKALSARIFDDYLTDLDPHHLYFTQEDVSELSKKYRRKLNDLLVTERAMLPAREIFSRYQVRVRERVREAQELLAKEEFTFQGDRFIPADREELSWPADEEEARAQWKLVVEEKLLSQILYREGLRKRASEKGKNDPFAGQPSPAKKLSLHYERKLQGINNSDEEDIANYFLSAVAGAHGPHSDYFSAREADRFFSRMSNQFVGIGAELRIDNGATRITGIFNGGPADRGGDLQLDDRIIGVDPDNNGKWIDVRFMRLDKITEKVKGKAGTKVGLKIESSGDGGSGSKTIVIERGRVESKGEEATATVFEAEGAEILPKIGLLEVPSFYFDRDDPSRNVATHVEQLLRRLKKEEIQGLIIDLRGNGGGSLNEVCRMTGLFVGRGPVVQVKSTHGRMEVLRSEHRKPLYTGAIVVLTDEDSASASEIFAAALQDYNRAVVVGAPSTFGKGTVWAPKEIAEQMPILADKERAGTLKLTIQKYYRVSGKSVQMKGVGPDIILPSLGEVMEVGEKYADHALAYDLIRKASYRPFNRLNLHLPELLGKSEERVKENQDFAYLREDISRYERQTAENRKSLNIEVRRTELSEAEARRKLRNDERSKRFARMEEQDTASFTAYRLTLDDLQREELVPLKSGKKEDRYIRYSKDEITELEDTLEWPSGIDHVRREGLNVLKDLLTLEKANLTAGILRKS